MRIGVTTFGGDGGASGIGRYIVRVVDALVRLEGTERYEVVTQRDERDVFLPKSDRASSLFVSEASRSPVPNILWHQLRLPRLARKRSWDVAFLPAGNRRLPLRMKTPTVGTVHDFSGIHVAEKYDPARMVYIKRVLPFLARRLNRVIAISESAKRDLVEFARVPESRIAVTPLGVDHGVFYPRSRRASAEEMREKYGVRPPYICYVSRIEHPGKNHARLIDAFARLKERKGLPHQLVFVGAEWTRAAEVREAAERSGWADDIVFTGFAAELDIPVFYAGADLFVFPSLCEGFGMPVLEAMACGTPVACSNTSSLPEVAGDAALMFDPLNAEEMAETMDRLLNDGELRERMIERAIERARAFTWRSTAEKTLRVLRAAAEEHRG